MTLNFADSNSAGPWLATAALSRDQMSVKYNTVMMLADFTDGVYARVPPLALSWLVKGRAVNSIKSTLGSAKDKMTR